MGVPPGGSDVKGPWRTPALPWALQPLGAVRDTL